MTERFRSVLFRPVFEATVDAKAFELVVIGAPRGGTTMVAGLAHKMGVDMNIGATLAYEDVKFLAHKGDRSIFSEEESKARYIEQIIPIIERRASQNKRWGWKDPLSVHYIEDITPHLRNPRFVFVWRSPLATAQGEARYIERLSGEVDTAHFNAILDMTIKHYMSMNRLVSRLDYPLLHVDYEKVFSNKRELVSGLASFLDVALSRSLAVDLYDFIAPAQEAYDVFPPTTEQGA